MVYITLQALAVSSVIERTLQWTWPRRKSIASTRYRENTLCPRKTI